MKRPLVSIKVENVYAYAHITNTKLVDIILKDMSFYVDNYKYMKSYKSKRWDGRINFAKYLYPKLRVYTGLLIRLLNILKKNGFDYEITDTRVKPVNKTDIELKDASQTLRDYQEAEMVKIIKEQRGIIQAPTGSGKTEMFIHLISRLKYPAIIITHTQDLLFQTADRCINALNIPEIGVIGAGINEPSDFVTVALFQSLLSIYKDSPAKFNSIINKYPILIVDEAHHVNYNAKMFTKIIEMSNAYYRYAFSATPKRNKSETATDIQLVALFGNTIAEINKAELIEKGWLSPFEVRVIHYPVTNYVATKQEYLMEYGLDSNGEMTQPQKAYREAFNDLVINNPDRLKAIAWVVKQHPNEQLLISCHSEELSQVIAKEIGIREITGNTQRFSRTERDTVYKEFRDGTIKHLVATNIYSEGVDFPKLTVIILAEPFKSGILLLQKIGRTMRLDSNKTKGIVYDFADTKLPFFSEQYQNRLLKYKDESIVPIEIKLTGSDVNG